MLILVSLVLWFNKLGYTAAMILNGYSLFMSTAFIIRMQTMTALPGVISYMGVFLILTMIFLYRSKISTYIKRNEQQQRELSNMAYYDGLTGLPNRIFFKESLGRDLSLARRTGTLLSVIFIDLDAFKDINDTLGHKAGDEVLVTISRRITSVMRNEDVLSRFGGDEFLMKAINIHSVEDIRIIAEKILGVFQETLTIEEMEFFTTASIGISVFPHDGENAEQLIKNADMAMYRAKDQGKNRYAFCSRQMREDSLRKLSLANMLHRAQEKQELYLLYQPQLQIGTEKIVGFEALLRWKNSRYGIISPDEFIPMAEYAGTIRPIGLWVFSEVCLQYKKWKGRSNFDIRMSVNMSVEQLKDDRIVEQIGDVLEETGVPATAIEIEVTESTAFTDSYGIIDKLTELQKKGFQIAIDDFGKKYSSLNRIRTFPVDRIKIDMDFIHGISSGDSRDRAVVKTIIQLGNNLGIQVIAEGAETREQYEFLEEESCDEVQGFLFYKGMLPEKIENLLASEQDSV